MSRNLPLLTVVYDVVRSKKVINDRDLYELVSSKIPGISLSQIEEALLKLEVMGKVVTSASGKKGELLIEIAGERRYLTPDEE
ncbi:MAG: hypothetical protein QI197_00805 [Candidatus Korarchaeota archaeon]|nr:hypothetical protein [Candidatus Korarchaeota archaeon]